MLAITLMSGEVETLSKQQWSAGGVAALVASCLGGLGMSYFSFALRAVISATSFSVIGNVCKVLTILVNLLMWDNHASAPPPSPSLPNLLPPCLSPDICASVLGLWMLPTLALLREMHHKYINLTMGLFKACWVEV